MRIALILPALLCITSSSLTGAQLPVARPARGVLVVARPGIPDPRFQQAVILLLAHDERGTLGLVLNRPTGTTLPDAPGTRHRMYLGGPVAPDRVVVLSRSEVPAGPHLTVIDGVWSSSDQGVIDAALKANADPEVLRVFRGHAAWAPGQLDAELAFADAWDLFLAEVEEVFSANPGGMWGRFMGTNRSIRARATACAQAVANAAGIGGRPVPDNNAPRPHRCWLMVDGKHESSDTPTLDLHHRKAIHRPATIADVQMTRERAAEAFTLI